MRVPLSALVAVIFSASSSSSETIEEYTTMSRWEQNSFSLVAEACFDDVSRICHPQKIPSSAAATAGEATSSSSAVRRDAEATRGVDQQQQVQVQFRPMTFDPFVSIHQGQQRQARGSDLQQSIENNPFLLVDFHRQALEEFDSFVDNFLRPRESEWIVIFDSSSSSTNLNQKPPCRKRLGGGGGASSAEANSSNGVADGHVHHLVRNIAGSVPVSDVNHVAKKLQEHGNALLDNSDKVGLTQIGRRMARRLQEVSPEQMMSYKRSFLPFSYSDNECLASTYTYNMDILKSDCVNAMRSLDIVRRRDYDSKMEEQQRDSVMYGHILVMYFFLSCTLMLFAIRRRRLVKRDLRMQERILTAIYSTPALKRQVELKIGESAGLVPPVPLDVMIRRGYFGAASRRRLECLRSYKGLALIYVITVGMVLYPITMVKGAAFMSIVACIYAAVIAPKKAREPICTCCCCKMTTEDLKNGTVTKEQACCGCCQGTGVCSVQCASCCGPPTPICTCCCCSMTTEDAKNGTATKEQECCGCCKGTGVCSVQCASCCGPPAPMCTCCCCKMTSEDAKNGTVTKEQACCGCCQGTGVCSVQCASCCGPKADTKKMNKGCCGGIIDHDDDDEEDDDGCCCCGDDNDTTDEKTVPLMKKRVYDGRPIQVV